MASASRGEIPKRSGSKSPTASRKEPWVIVERGSSPPFPRSAGRSQPRSSGSGPTVSRPSTSRSHRSVGEWTPPGRRQPIPTTAIGSGEPVRSISFRSRSFSFNADLSAATRRGSSVVICRLLSMWGCVVLASQGEFHEGIDVHGVDAALLGSGVVGGSVGVGGGLFPWGGLRPFGVQQLPQQECECARVRMVEDRGGRNADPDRVAESVTQLHPGQRVQSQVGEGPVALHSRNPCVGGMSQDHGGVCTYLDEQCVFPFGPGQVGEPIGSTVHCRAVRQGSGGGLPLTLG